MRYVFMFIVVFIYIWWTVEAIREINNCRPLAVSRDGPADYWILFHVGILFIGVVALFVFYW